MDAVTRYPTAFARWLSAADFALGNLKQIAVVFEADSEKADELLQVVQSAFRPNVIAASSYPPLSAGLALLMDRPLKNRKPTVYVWEGFVCKNPVNSLSELEKLL